MRFGHAFGVLTLGLCASGFLRAEPAPAPISPDKITFAGQIAPLLAAYCNKCHGGDKPKGELALDKFKTETDALKDLNVWAQVAQRVRAKEMPPGRRTQPKPAEVDLLTSWIDSKLGVANCLTKKDPGRITLRRLNRAEYNNTIRDLVGIAYQPAEDFPADDVGYGFDNIGDVLSLPPLLFEKYLAASEKIVATAFADPRIRARIMIATPTPPPASSTGKETTAKTALTSEECARKIIGAFARKAYRRPVAGPEIDRLATFVRLAESQGDSFDKGIQVALQAVLTSPHFLFRVERDRRPLDPDAVHPVSNFELATRLSYFLWSSMPDEELFRQAQDGTLRKNLDAQVKRMLRDTRSHAITENFAGQWLQLRNLRTIQPDPDQFPSFNENLRRDMLKETELFFDAVVKEDRNILEFIDADFTFINERLAKHYGISGVKGNQFRRVVLTDGKHGGLLTHASVLTLTSNPTRTSPVKRGKWILETLLGTPPPPPPPNAGDLSEDKEVVLSGSLRQRMEQHRANPNCATCHQRMDPLGFGFENFDAIGAWRERDGKFPVDASGILPDGRTFKGPAELKRILRSREQDFTRCLTEKLLTYALGRGTEAYDRCAVDKISEAVASQNHTFSALVSEIVKSDPFQMRRGTPFTTTAQGKKP